MYRGFTISTLQLCVAAGIPAFFVPSVVVRIWIIISHNNKSKVYSNHLYIVMDLKTTTTATTTTTFACLYHPSSLLKWPVYMYVLCWVHSMPRALHSWLLYRNSMIGWMEKK